jgi:hypothetical protein
MGMGLCVGTFHHERPSFHEKVFLKKEFVHADID